MSLRASSIPHTVPLLLGALQARGRGMLPRISAISPIVPLTHMLSLCSPT